MPISLLLSAFLACGCGPSKTAPPAPRSSGPKHVFVIVLENQNVDVTFGSESEAPYLAGALKDEGAFLPGYYGIGHHSLPNYIAMVSGQAPTTSTQADCPVFTDVLPGTPARDGQVAGQGCVYPRSVKTVADQLEGKGLSWKGYMEDMGADAARDGGTTCAHPAIDTPDHTEGASPDDQYATRHNPFVYFHSIIDRPAGCRARDVPLDRLEGDLKSERTTANLSFISPDLCHDGHDAACADGSPGGLLAADGFLRTWVPRITASPAYREDGLLAIVFDEAGDDASACCGERPGPNTPAAGAPAGGPGGGRTGAVLLSPFISPGTETTTEYNHYALLRSIEDFFGLPHLGYAAADGLRPFGRDVFTR